MVSVVRPSGELTHLVWPVVLSMEMKRWAPPASGPHMKVSPLTITWSPSTIGDDMRPPCVVHIPYSSASERSHRSLPSLESDMRRPPPLIAKTFPLAGSTAGEDHAIR